MLVVRIITSIKQVMRLPVEFSTGVTLVFLWSSLTPMKQVTSEEYLNIMACRHVARRRPQDKRLHSGAQTKQMNGVFCVVR
jgi:hypothetical protein